MKTTKILSIILLTGLLGSCVKITNETPALKVTAPTLTASDSSIVTSDPIISNGLIAFYPFNGNANDESGNGNTGIIYGTTLTKDRKGNLNSAYYFDGSYIRIPNNNKINNSPRYTISVWVYVERFKGSDAEGGYIISKGLYPNYNYDIAAGNLQNTNSLNTSTTYNDNFVGYQSANTFKTNTWYLMTVTNDGSNLKTFINGVLNDYMSVGISQTNNNDIYIGRYEGSNLWNYKGKLDDIRIYNRALNTTEISELYNE
jgi:hypothetical protein